MNKRYLKRNDKRGNRFRDVAHLSTWSVLYNFTYLKNWVLILYLEDLGLLPPWSGPQLQYAIPFSYNFTLEVTDGSFMESLLYQFFYFLDDCINYLDIWTTHNLICYYHASLGGPKASIFFSCLHFLGWLHKGPPLQQKTTRNYQPTDQVWIISSAPMSVYWIPWLSGKQVFHHSIR